MSPLALALFVVLSALAAGALVYAILQPSIASQKKAETRRSAVARSEDERSVAKSARDRLQEQSKRRRNIQSSLKQVEERQRERSKHATQLSLKRRIEQAGLSLSVRQFVIGSVAIGFVAGSAGFLFLPPVTALGLAVVAGIGLPRFLLARRRKKRLARFTLEFPNAIDLIVRGIRSGLPLNDTMRMISTEAAEPVRSEFRKVVEAQQLGMSIGDAVERLYWSVPISETNFFAIVIGIQSQAGGNLSEALSNLSRVLRERRKLKEKIQAMSMEAKASGWIIGSLPVIVAVLVYLTSPDYISVLFTEEIGHMILLGSALWMACGILTMKKMINFDF